MQYLADLHLHSKYSRAVSPKMTLPVMAQFARQKGLDILSASDFTHPVWFKEISAQLEEVGQGVYRLRDKQQETRDKDVLFLLSTEISSIYKQGNKLRRIHNLVFLPSLEAVERLNKELISRGCNLNADGRPIIGLSSRDLLELILGIDERSLLIPCHVWTPHFGVYGSKSGFDSLTEAFGDLAKYVYGIETGISSDPEMNWRIEELKNRSILSFSDAHSPANMGREAAAFELEKLSFENIRQAIMRKGEEKNKVAYTIEFYPEEGKYHFSGHRSCGVSFTPDEVLEKGNICPVCHREFTEGVAVRIEQLAGKDYAKEYKEKLSDTKIMWYTDASKNHPPYVKLVRLEQVIAAGFGTTPNTIKVKSLYAEMCKSLDSEINILLKTPLNEVGKIAGEKVVEALRRVRGGKIKLDAGYDGTYGVVKIFSDEEKKDLKSTAKDASQMSLDL